MSDENEAALPTAPEVRVNGKITLDPTCDEVWRLLGDGTI